MSKITKVKNWEPDYRNLLNAAYNREASRLPLYEHIICPEVMEDLLEKPFAALSEGNEADRREFLSIYCNFFREMGYDTVSYENCIGTVMPGSGALGRHVDPVIKTREDFDKYPWDTIPDLFFDRYGRDFALLREVMPIGMKAIGGPGNGIFECVQEITGFMGLCYIAADDPDLYAELFQKVGDTNYAIWKRFMEEYGDIYCVMRFGDDLGHKTSSMLSTDDIKTYILPQYKRIVDLVHSHHKPFLLHSCGCIFDVMEDIIEKVGINAKHSNEDQIARFPVWVEKYGDRIGNFGGIDTDAVCRLDRPDLKAYILDVIPQCEGHGGFAFGSGNSIPDYVPPENYLYMVETVREYRGDYR